MDTQTLLRIETKTSLQTAIEQMRMYHHDGFGWRLDVITRALQDYWRGRKDGVSEPQNGDKIAMKIRNSVLIATGRAALYTA